MPIRYEKDNNGRWKAVGVASRDELTPQQLAPGSAEAKRVAGFGRAVGAQARLKGRPVVWAGPDLGWQSPKSFEKAKAQGRLPKPAEQPVNRRTGLSWLQNELAWVGKGIQANVQDTMKRGPSLAHLSFGPVLGPVIGTIAGRQNVAAYQVGALDNALKSGEALVQSLQGKEVNPGQASWIRKLTAGGYRAFGAKPPSEMSAKELETDSTFRSLGLNVAVSAAMVPLAPMAAGATIAGTAVRGAGLFVGEQLISTALDDNTQGNASNLTEAALGAMGIQAQVPGAVRPTDDWGEATRKSLIPNTVAAGLFGAGLNLIGRGMGVTASSFGNTKRWLKERRVTSEVQRSRAWAQERGLIAEGEQGFVNRYSPPEFVGDLSMARQRPAAAMPNAGPAMDVQGQTPAPMAPGVSLDQAPAAAPATGPVMGIEGPAGAPAMADVALEGPAPMATPRAYQAPAGPAEPQPQIIGRPDPYSPVQERLRQMDAAQNPDTAAYQQWLEANQQVAGVPSRQMEMGGPVLDGELPRVQAESGDPWVDPADFNPVADPSLPETDQLVRDIWDLDDASLIAAAENPGPVVPGVSQQLAGQRAFDPAGDPRFQESAADLATAPGEALGFRGPEGLAAYEAQLRQEEWSGLRALTDPDNNPRVARLIESNTGRDPAEFTREDMIEGLLEVARAEDRFVIPRPNGELNRPGEVVMPVEDLGVDPSRFQFKGGINPTTGEQLGQSLEGVDAWNTDLEGTVSAWRDPADGSAWVINGHNRVAAARRLGVKSLPVKFYEAPDARNARAIGAAQNIATGQGTPIDAAKFMRDTGVTDVAQLQSLVPGMPLKSGWAEQGLALSRLPADAFAAVVQGDLSVARGVLIGSSGKTPEEMSALWRYAEKRNVSDRVLRELVAMTAPEATATPAAAKQGSIWDVLGSDSAEAKAFNAGLVTKARLVDRVRSRLAADRRLFATVAGRGAAERLQAGAANTIDAAGSRAVATQADQVLGVFDQLRYQTGPVGDLLNQGVMRLDGGEAIDAVAKDVANQVADAMEQTLGGGRPVGERMVAVPSADQIAWAEANLLTPKKLANRLAKKAQLDEQFAAVEDLVANPEKYAGVPESELPSLPKNGGKAAYKRLDLELKAHAKAEEILAEVARAEQRGPVAAEMVTTAMEPPAVEAQGPVRLSPQEREQLQVELVQRAIDGDEVRPPATPEPELLAGPQVPLARALDVLDNEGLAYGNDAAQAVADELRLAAEYSYRDAAMQKAAKEAFREETGYYELDPSERLASGQFRDGFRDEPAVGTGLEERAAYARQQRQQAEAAGDQERAMAWREEERRLERSRLGNAMDAGGQTQQGLFGAGEYDTGAPLLNQPPQGRDAAASFQLPVELQRSAPRYGMATIKFASDLDRAAYVLANDAVKPSKAAAKFRAAVDEAGLDVGEVIAHGRKVKQAIKDAAGGGAAPQKPSEIELPAQRWGGGPMANPQLFDDLADPTKGPTLDRLLFGEIPPTEREALLKKVGNERMDGIWTLGQEGAANRIEEDILKFVQRMTGGTKADIADAVFVRTNGAGYGRGGAPVAEQVGGVQADFIYNEDGAVLLIARYDDLLRKQGLAEMAQTGAHEAVHFLQTRRLTQKQLEVLTSDEAVTYFRTEAGKARVAGVDGLANIELMAWGSQRVIAARLLRDMESLYRQRGLKKAADYVARARVQKLGEYKAPPTRLEQALEPLIGLWERVKNYLLGAGFKLNKELTTEQLEIMAQFTGAVNDITGGRIRITAETPMPEGVREILDAAYVGQIGKQMYLRPGRMGERALANYERRWDVLGVTPGDYDASRLAQQPQRPMAPTPPERPKPLRASPVGLVPADQAMPLTPFGPLDLLNNPVAMGPQELVLPEAVLRTAPTYGRAEVRFSSPLDQAAYVLAREAGAQPSRAVNQLRKALEAAGYDPADVARYGRERVQPAVRDAAAGGSAARPAGGQVELMDQGYQGPTRLPRTEVQRLKAQMSALDQELAGIDAELAQLTKQAALGGCN